MFLVEAEACSLGPDLPCLPLSLHLSLMEAPGISSRNISNLRNTFQKLLDKRYFRLSSSSTHVKEGKLAGSASKPLCGALITTTVWKLRPSGENAGSWSWQPFALLGLFAPSLTRCWFWTFCATRLGIVFIFLCSLPCDRVRAPLCI